ncbi:MAG: MinD/ParA family protein [Bacillaceae bacterium]|nr:MinD/ParA family protein [Bacillaceae bacterium]
MLDQASKLREKMQNQDKKDIKQTRVITVTSGKGGVGKSNFTLNFALSLMDQGKKVVIFDVDLGLANIDVLMGVSSKYSILEMIENQKSIWDIMEKGPGDLEYIAGGSGFNQLMRLDEDQLDYFFHQLEQLQGYTDIILMDTGAGISRESLRFILSADDVILVTTPEPTSLTDAYAVIKMVHGLDPAAVFRLVVNRVTSLKEGKHTADKIAMVASQFLGVDIDRLGYLPDDDHVMRAVKKQIPFYLQYPQSMASQGIRRMAEVYLRGKDELDEAKGMKGFVDRLKNWMKLT